MFAINKISGKVHVSSCSNAQKIGEKNRLDFETLDDAITCRKAREIKRTLCVCEVCLHDSDDTRMRLREVN